MAELLAVARQLHPDAIALSDEFAALTWAQLDARVNRWIHVLREVGLQPGQTIAIVAENRRETFEALLACLHTQIIVVPVNWHLTAEEIAYLLDDAPAHAVLADPAHVATTADAATGRNLVRLVFGDEPVGEFAAVEPLLSAASDTEPADQACGGVMPYTSGTTGKPKGVVLSLIRAGRPLAEVTRALDFLGRAFEVPDDGHVLLCGPWYHSGQMFFALFPLLRGSALTTRYGFDPAEVLRVVDAAGITLTHLVPTQFIRMLRLDDSTRAAFRGDSLRRVWHGGGPCPLDVKRAMIDWWGPVLVEYYGATENGIATLIESADWLRRPGSVGRATSGAELLVVDEHGTPVPAGISGRIFVRRRSGRGFEYHNAPTQTSEAYLDSAHFTYGDIGRLDEDGYLYLTGRHKDVVVSGGVNIYPAEVEAVLLDHPQVRDAAVIGVPDMEFGEQVRAVVEVEPDATVADLETLLDQYCRTRLAGFKVPRSYHFVDRLPREESGKIRKQALRNSA